MSGYERVDRNNVEPSQNRKMRSDLFGSSQAAQMLSTLVIIMAMAQIVGPLLGGAILEFGSWHGIFWLMALSFANKKLVKRYALNRLLVVSTLVAALAASVLFTFAFFKIGRVLGVIIPMFFVFSINGIIASCSNAALLIACRRDEGLWSLRS